MTKFQALIVGIGIGVVGVALVITGAIVKNDTILGLGMGLVTSGLASLGIPRPTDV